MSIIRILSKKKELIRHGIHNPYVSMRIGKRRVEFFRYGWICMYVIEYDRNLRILRIVNDAYVNRLSKLIKELNLWNQMKRNLKN